jgi:ComF family protein
MECGSQKTTVIHPNAKCCEHMVSKLNFFKSWLDLLFESRCPLCQRSTSQSFCCDCQRRIERCQFQSIHQSDDDTLSIFAWGVYGGALKQAIAALKYNNHPQLARPLGQYLARAWLTLAANPPKQLIVVPIPMHPHKQKQRGYNQADLLAKAFCEFTGLPLRNQGLARTRTTQAQFTLSRDQREQNLKGAFELGRHFRQSRPVDAVLLLDDIYTSGATARSASETLRKSHIQVYGIAALAKPLEGKTDAEFRGIRRDA